MRVPSPLTIDQVRLNPGPERLATEDSSSKVERATFRIVHRRIELLAVQHEERLEGRVADTFVAIDKGMIQHEGVNERGALGREAEIQIGAIKRGPRLREGRF